MEVLVILLFIIPGLVTEFIFESQNLSTTTNVFYRILRGIAFNIPITVFTWLVIWFWKVILHNYRMISSLNRFWYKCLNEPFLLKYCLVVLLGIVITGVLFKLYSFIYRKSEE